MRRRQKLMLDIQLGQLAPENQSVWRRLSATQHLMLRGMGVLVVVLLIGSAMGGWSRRAIASDQWDPSETISGWSEWRILRHSLDSASGELELARLRLERADDVLRLSSRYRLPADSAALIYDAALQAGIDPELAFRLVRVESEFNPQARSSMGAIGLAQVQLATARIYEPEITLEQLFEPAVNLRIGFGYLRDLIEYYGDLRVALLAYNRGPTRVTELMGEGRDPRNGYASSIMDG